jgi:hypothetical protein
VDQRLFLDFEYVFAVSVSLVLLLMYLFYVKYPFDSDRGTKSERIREARDSNQATRDEGKH